MHQTDTTEWIVCGSSPSANEYLRLCRYRYPLATKIATNSAGRLFPEGPDFYYVSDFVACQKYKDDCIRYRRQGTKLLSLHRSPKALVQRGTSAFDELLKVTGPGATWKWRKGEYTDFGMSGLYCVQYALNNGAERVHLVGHEGYRSVETCPEFDHFDGAPGPTNGAHLTKVVIQPAMQAMVECAKHVEFYFYGAMNYTVTGDNVHYIGNHEGLVKDEPLPQWNNGKPGPTSDKDEYHD